MFGLLETDTFSEWLAGLRDGMARARIQKRLDCLSFGNPGDVKPLGKGLSEMRVDYGPGYRIYCFRRANEILVLLAGGDKRTQRRDIAKAFELMEIVRTTPWPE